MWGLGFRLGCEVEDKYMYIQGLDLQRLQCRLWVRSWLYDEIIISNSLPYSISQSFPPSILIPKALSKAGSLYAMGPGEASLLGFLTEKAVGCRGMGERTREKEKGKASGSWFDGLRMTFAMYGLQD